MSSIEHSAKNKTFRFATVGLPIVMTLAALVLGHLANSLFVFLTVCYLYWVTCWTLFFFSGKPIPLVAMYRAPINRKPVEFVMTWLPPLAVFLVTLTSSWPSLPLPAFIAVLGVAVVNGVTEEMFWRGKFVATFPNQIGWALIFPTIVFTLWHIALLCIPDVEYEAGAFGMLGGAAFMGSLWGYAHWQTRDLRSVTIAHVMTNFFAFSMLAETNWYS